MQIYRTNTYTDMSRKAALILLSQILLQPRCVLGLATGSTPLGVYQNLINWYKDGDLDFSGVTTFNLDEYRGLAEDHPQSYRYFMENNLFQHINIQKENTFVPNGMNPDAQGECKGYELSITRCGGIDMQLLGLGHNGHIGFNEPNDTFEQATHCVTLAPSTIQANKRFFEHQDHVPKEAYTMGIGSIMQAKRILVIVSGAEKAEIVKKAFTGPVTPQVPASILQMHPNVTLVGDTAALALL